MRFWLASGQPGRHETTARTSRLIALSAADIMRLLGATKTVTDLCWTGRAGDDSIRRSPDLATINVDLYDLQL
jgi:hypothetical protein